MSKQVLDISQMQHLKELGVDTSKATCSYDVHKPTNECKISFGLEEDDNDVMFEVIPTFTLQDILDLLPCYISSYELCTKKIKLNGYINYVVAYIGIDEQCFLSFLYDELIDAAYEMLCWCIKNGYIETKKK